MFLWQITLILCDHRPLGIFDILHYLLNETRLLVERIDSLNDVDIVMNIQHTAGLPVALESHENSVGS